MSRRTAQLKPNTCTDGGHTNTDEVVDIGLFPRTMMNETHPKTDDDFQSIVSDAGESGGPPRPIKVIETDTTVSFLTRTDWKFAEACRKAGLTGLATADVEITKSSACQNSLGQPTKAVHLPPADCEPPDSANDMRNDVVLSDESTKSSPVREELRASRTIRIDQLEPNAINSQIFNVSLADESIAVLAQDIRRNGLRQPIEVNRQNVILDGHRRWLALKQLGVVSVDVWVVDGVEEEEGIRGFVIDACSSQRSMTTEERVNVYETAQLVLRRRYGRPHGRPKEKDERNANLFRSAENIRDEAAKLAGFGTFATANRARCVFREGDEELKDAVNAGNTSIYSAYLRVRGRKKKRETEVATSPAVGATTSETEPRAVTTTLDDQIEVVNDPIAVEATVVSRPEQLEIWDRTLDVAEDSAGSGETTRVDGT